MRCFIFGSLATILGIVACSNGLNPYDISSKPIPAPTASTIVYNSIRENAIHLRVSNSDYSESYRLTPFALATLPDWSPDKQWITYSQDFRIWKMVYDGTHKTVLTPESLDAQASRFSPDGQSMVFVVSKPDIGYTLYVVDDDGGRLRQVITDRDVASTGTYSFLWPDWSPDGRAICFSYARLDTNDFQSYIATWDIIAKRFSLLNWTDGDLLPAQPRWSPTRNELLVGCSMREGGRDIWRVRIDGSSPTRLTYTKRSSSPEWSHDGEYFLYQTHVDTIRTLWKMRRDGSENQQIIIDNDPYAGEPSW